MAPDMAIADFEATPIPLSLEILVVTVPPNCLIAD
jgi:hypothetical protein